MQGMGHVFAERAKKLGECSTIYPVMIMVFIYKRISLKSRVADATDAERRIGKYRNVGWSDVSWQGLCARGLLLPCKWDLIYECRRCAKIDQMRGGANSRW
jgi:hypothetical protein